MPDTKPDLTFDERGVCNACQNFEKRASVDWPNRRKALQGLFDHFKSATKSKWNCIVPVSGGKDSTYQVLKVLEFGMKPLCVVATTCSLTEIGRRNIQNIRKLGVDLLEFSPDPLVRKRLNRIGLFEIGDISWPEHVGIFTIPVQIAVEFSIPLLIWGENSQNEYGGPEHAIGSTRLDRQWLEEFGGLLGLRVSDLVESFGFSEADLAPYIYPPSDEVERIGVTGIFLGSFLPWDGLSNMLVSQAHGLETFGRAIEGTMLDYENLDNFQAGVHEYFKFLKFGFGRATDHACLHIRRGRISRSEGLEIVRKRDGRFPWSYMERPLVEILKEIDVSLDDFVEVCDRFTNRDLFTSDSSGNLKRDSRGNLMKVNYDNL